MPIKISRRAVLKGGSVAVGVAAGVAAGTAALVWAGMRGRRLLGPRNPSFPGRIVGANSKVGHWLRERKFPGPSSPQPDSPLIESIDTVIVGGGISGLSAAWWLRRQGRNNF